MTNDITYGESEILTVVSDFGTPQTVACQAPLSMEFSSQKYWSGSCFLLQEIFPTQESNPGLLQPQVDSSSSEPRKNKKWPRITPEKVTGTEREGKFQREKIESSFNELILDTLNDIWTSYFLKIVEKKKICLEVTCLHVMQNEGKKIEHRFTC